MPTGRDAAEVKGLRWAGIALLLAACSGGPGGDPAARAEVVEVLRRVTDQEPMTVTLELPDATAEDLNRLNIGIEPDVAAVVEGARVTMANDFAPDPLDGHVSIRVELTAGSMEIRQVEDDLYLRADVADLFRAFGADPRPIARAAARDRTFRPLVEPALRGEWIHVAGAGSYILDEAAGVGTEGSERATEALLSAIDESAAVTRAGSDAAGDQYDVEIEFARFARALFDAAGGLVPDPPSEDELEAVPDETLHMDVWLEDGELRRLEADVSQLINLSRGDAAVDRPPVVLRVDVMPFEGLERPRASARMPAELFRRLLALGGA